MLEVLLLELFLADTFGEDGEIDGVESLVFQDLDATGVRKEEFEGVVEGAGLLEFCLVCMAVFETALDQSAAVFGEVDEFS